MRRLGFSFLFLLGLSPLRAETGAAWARLLSPELRSLDQRHEEIRAALDALPEARFRPASLPVGYRSQPAPVAETEKWVEIDLGAEYPVDDIVLVPAWFRFGDFPGPGFGFPVRFRVDLPATAGEKTTLPPEEDPFPWTPVPGTSSRPPLSWVPVADFTQSDLPNPGLAPVSIHVGGRRARYVRVVATKLWRRIDEYIFALGELLVVSGNRNRAYHRVALVSDSFESPGMWSRHFLTDDSSVLGNPTDMQMLPTNGHHSEIYDSPDATHWVQVDLGRPMRVDEIHLIPARPIDFPDTIGFGFPLRFRLEGSSEEDFRSVCLFEDHTGADFPNPGDRPVVIPGGGKEVRYVRLTATRQWQRDESKWVLAMAEMQIMSGGRNMAIDQGVTASDAVDSGINHRWNPAYLVDDVAPRPGLGNIADWLSALATRQALEAELAGLESRRAVVIAAAETTLLWGTGGLAGGVALLSVILHRRSRARHRLEARKLREDIAQDLHDEVGSNLGSIAILSQLALDSPPDDEAVRGELEEIHRVAHETTQSMRDIVWLISPGEKTANDLAARLRASAASLLAGLEWTWAADGLRGSLSLTAQRDVLLLLKEALHNVRRHASARHVDLCLSGAGGEFRMEITDDGTGFDPAAASGHGLPNMHRRAARLRGKLTLDSTPGRGTRLVLTLPLSHP